MIRMTTLAILAITTVTTSALANDLSDQIKAKVQQKIAQRLGVSGPRQINNTNNVNGDDNLATNSADGSQNLTVRYREGDIAYTDSRSWSDSHDVSTSDSRSYSLRQGDRTSTYSPTYTEGSRTDVYAPRTAVTPVYERHVVAPMAPYVPAARLTYSMVVTERPTVIAIRRWAPCGSYFVDSEGRRFTLLPTYSKVAYEYQYTTLPGHYWRSSASGTLFYTASWGSLSRTFQHTGL